MPMTDFERSRIAEYAFDLATAGAPYALAICTSLANLLIEHASEVLSTCTL